MAGFLASLLGIGASGSTSPNPDDPRYWREGQAGQATWSGNKVTPDLAMRVSAVYAAVSVLANVTACLPVEVLELDREGHYQPVPFHPLAELLGWEPNSWQTAFDFRAMLMSHLCLRGNALAEIVPGTVSAIGRLEPIHPDRVEHIDQAPDGRLRYRVRNLTGGGVRLLLQDELLHIRAPIAPGAGYWAASPVDYARQTVGLALAAEEHGARSFANGARPSGAVTMPGVMGEEAFERFKTSMQEFTGLNNSGKTLILEGGAKFEAISLSAEQLQFIATRQFQIEEIARWFNVPLVMLHHMTGQSTWGSGLEQIMLAFVRNNLRPWLTAWEQAIRRDLIVAKRKYVVRFDIEDLIRGDSTAVANFISRLTLNGVISRNEGREMIGFNPKPGLDEHLTPSNTATNDGQPDNGGNTPPPDGDAPPGPGR